MTSILNLELFYFKNIYLIVRKRMSSRSLFSNVVTVQVGRNHKGRVGDTSLKIS